MQATELSLILEARRYDQDREYFTDHHEDWESTAKYPETQDRQSWSLLSCHGAGPGKKNVVAPTKHKMMAFKAQSLQPGTCLPAGTLATRERILALPTSLYLWLPILSGMTESDSWRLVYDLTSSLQKRLQKQRYGSFHF